MRIGHGFDVHAFCEGDAIVLGGVRIPHRYSFKAHSDGDVLIHALCDALLGAASLGDIGQHFPDSDERYRDADSRLFLRGVKSLLDQHRLVLGNADITIIAQAPRMTPYVEKMTSLLAEDLQCESTQLNIKATTTERLGFTGREEGIAVHAVVLLEVMA